MADSIKNRIFGSHIPGLVKRKIELRQLYSEKSNPEASDLDSIQSEYGDKGDYKNNFGDNSSIADLSSRSPFIRMWTAVELTRDVVIDVLDEKSAIDES